MRNQYRFQCVVIGVSAGGLNALGAVLPALPAVYPVPVVVVQHLSPHSDNYSTRYLDSISAIRVKEVDEKEIILPGFVYTAPPNYHVLVEEDKTFSLSVEDRINFARPAVDVLFESAADVFSSHLIGVVLTGANNDGSKGLKKIKDAGGLTVVQDPETAEVDGMPRAAIDNTSVDRILQLEDVGPFLVQMAEVKTGQRLSFETLPSLRINLTNG